MLTRTESNLDTPVDTDGSSYSRSLHLTYSIYECYRVRVDGCHLRSSTAKPRLRAKLAASRNPRSIFPSHTPTNL